MLCCMQFMQLMLYIVLLYNIIVYYSYHMNRADYLLSSSFQYNTVLNKNGDYDDPDDVENIIEW